LLATLHSTADLSIVGWLVALFAVLAAGYMAYLQNFVATFLLLVVAVFAVVLLT
jgi:hypothetical protein